MAGRGTTAGIVSWSEGRGGEEGKGAEARDVEGLLEQQVAVDELAEGMPAARFVVDYWSFRIETDLGRSSNYVQPRGDYTGKMTWKPSTFINFKTGL